MKTAAKTLKLRAVREELGLNLPELRRLLDRDASFPPVTWTGPRSGFVFREDFDQWIADRHAREARRRQQERRKRDFVAGRRPENGDATPRPLPDFLRP